MAINTLTMLLTMLVAAFFQAGATDCAADECWCVSIQGPSSVTCGDNADEACDADECWATNDCPGDGYSCFGACVHGPDVCTATAGAADTHCEGAGGAACENGDITGAYCYFNTQDAAECETACRAQHDCYAYSVGGTGCRMTTGLGSGDGECTTGTSNGSQIYTMVGCGPAPPAECSECGVDHAAAYAPGGVTCEATQCDAGFWLNGPVDAASTCDACADIMNDVVGVVDGSCTDCDGGTAADCAVATCEVGYENFVDGVGCTGIPCAADEHVASVHFELLQKGQYCSDYIGAQAYNTLTDPSTEVPSYPADTDESGFYNADKKVECYNRCTAYWDSRPGVITTMAFYLVVKDALPDYAAGSCMCATDDCATRSAWSITDSYSVSTTPRCVACPAGKIRTAGDKPSDGPTECYTDAAISSCDTVPNNLVNLYEETENVWCTDYAYPTISGGYSGRLLDTDPLYNADPIAECHARCMAEAARLAEEPTGQYVAPANSFYVVVDQTAAEAGGSTVYPEGSCICSYDGCETMEAWDGVNVYTYSGYSGSPYYGVGCPACADIMNAVVGVVDGSCTDCDGDTAANCAVATCETDHHTFADGVGCSACADIMNAVVGVVDGSCTDCDGGTAADCAVATCEDGYENFADGVGCTACGLGRYSTGGGDCQLCATGSITNLPTGEGSTTCSECGIENASTYAPNSCNVETCDYPDAEGVNWVPTEDKTACEEDLCKAGETFSKAGSANGKGPCQKCGVCTLPLRTVSTCTVSRDATCAVETDISDASGTAPSIMLAAIASFVAVFGRIA